MADIKISQLGAAIAVEDTDLVPIVSGGNTLKATAALLKRHAIGDDDISDIGDGTPTGAIAALNTELGTTKQALTNEVLYFDIPVRAIAGLIVNVSGGDYASITADHVVTSCVFDKPTAIYGNVTWQTGAGTLQLVGKCGDATNHYAHITLAKKGN